MTADLKQGSEPLGHHWKSAFEIRIAAPRARTGGGKVDRQELSPFKLVVIFSWPLTECHSCRVSVTLRALVFYSWP